MALNRPKFLFKCADFPHLIQKSELYSTPATAVRWLPMEDIGTIYNKTSGWQAARWYYLECLYERSGFRFGSSGSDWSFAEETLLIVAERFA